MPTVSDTLEPRFHPAASNDAFADPGDAEMAEQRRSDAFADPGDAEMAEQRRSDARRQKLVWAVLIFLLLAVTGLAVHFVTKGSAPQARQVARIAILPDTPPPPPPPPPEKKPELPKPDTKPVPQAEAPPKPVAPPAPAPIKMEGAAGNGPSAFAAGPVSQDYKGGAPTVGGTAASGGTLTDRAQERLYVNSVRQLLRDEIERHLDADAGELAGNFAIWIANDGRITRWDVDGGTGTGAGAGADGAREGALRNALERSAAALKLPTPPAVAQPLRFRLTVRAAG